MSIPNKGMMDSYADMMKKEKLWAVLKSLQMPLKGADHNVCG